MTRKYNNKSMLEVILFFLFSFGAFICLVFLINSFINREPRRRTGASYKSNRNYSSFFNIETERERAGRIGEQQAYKYICQVKRDDDVILKNVEFNYNGQDCEIDYVVINKYGVYIIEVKYYRGYINGDANSKTWSKTKITSSGKTYTNEFDSPLKQLNWQVDSLAKYLRENGIYVWIKGYCMILNNEHSQIDSEQVLHNPEETDRAIHTKAKENRRDIDINKQLEIYSLLTY